MKKHLILLLIIVCGLSHVNAQTHGITYQAIVINPDELEIPGENFAGLPLYNSEVAFRFTITNEETGFMVYQEQHFTSTDEYGMINLVIGLGQVTGVSPGMFIDIDWNGQAHVLTVELSHDSNGSAYEIFNDQDLYFVPYAFHRNITATGTMIIDGDTYLKSRLEVDGETTINNDLHVTNGSSTYLTGTLDVDDASTLNNTLTVTNESETNLTGILNVEGAAELNGEVNANNTLNVTNGSAANLSGVLNVEGIAELNGEVNANNTFNVTNGNVANLSGVLNVEGTSVFNNSIDANGQVSISSPIVGNEDDIDAYALIVEGGSQGVAVKVNGYVSESMNFLGFWDDSGIHGRIEGQTRSEITNSFDYIWDNAMSAMEVGFLAAEAAACGGQLDFAESAVLAAQATTLASQWAVLLDGYLSDVGVAFESGGADYAEWLMKADVSEVFSPGDVVGVKGGKISKYMTDPDHYMVISLNPVVVGNMPPEGKGQNYEKVAFIGQVPVKVRGNASIGDYIVGSSLNDGVAIAVSPDNMKMEHFGRVVGVAWSDSKENSGLTYINTAIGIHTNELALMVERQQQQLVFQQNQINHIAGYLKNKDPHFEFPETNTSAINRSVLNRITKVDHINEMKKQGENTIVIRGRVIKIQEEYIDEAMRVARVFLKERNVDYSKFEQTKRLLEDKEYLIKSMRESFSY